MDKVKNYIKIILGSIIIGVSLNLFFKGINFVPSGVYGIGYIYSYKMNVSFAATIFFMNLFCFALALYVYPKEYLQKTFITFWLIPLVVLLTQNIDQLIYIKHVDKLLLAIYGGFLVGLGSRFIYRADALASGIDIIASLSSDVFEHHSRWIIYLFDIILCILTASMFGYEKAMYSLIAIVLMEYIVRRATIGINTSKVFYIITKHEKEVKKYIMKELKYDFTEFDVKGGFSKDKNKILMCVIPTREYYRLREGIKLIDPEAFISITDSYEVINQDVAINSDDFI